MTDVELAEVARQAAENAYAPYSKYHVGAAALLRDGRIITGVNVENASYPLGLCAERCALARAVAEGVRPGEVEAVAVTASPCGGCRQWLWQMKLDRIIFRNAGQVVTMSPAELLPETFDDL